ncbi:MAG TPA: SulP family inorganic anion transporter [Acidimicrobiia bacterium]
MPGDGLFHRIPGVALARSYRKTDLVRDLTAGVVLATMLVPQGMAYAELTGLPAHTGLYTTVAGLVAYTLFGPNRVLILGPDSSLAPVIAAIVLPLAMGDPAAAVIFASALGLMTGLVCIVAGIVRIGVITELVSKPVRIGYLNGIAVVVLVSQLPKALGFSIDADSTVSSLVATVESVIRGEVVGAALVISALTLLVIQVVAKLWPGAPGVLLAVVAAMVGVAVFDLASTVATVGALPQGLASFVFPQVGFDELGPLAIGALAVALVSLADTAALSTAIGVRAGTRSDPNAEAKALGVANIFAGLFQGFPTSASSSRSAVAMSVGARTQLTGLVAAVAVTALLVWAPGLLADLPSATLAAIVIAASLVIFDGSAVRWLWSVRRSEFLLSVGASLGVVIFGVLEGILIAVVLSLANFIRRAWHPHSTELVRVHGLKGYHDRNRHPEGDRIPGLLIVRFDAPLFFANAPTFGRRLGDLMEDSSLAIERVVVAGEAITDVDTTGAEVLIEVLDHLQEQGLSFAFAGLKGPVKDRLRAYGLYDRIGDANFFPTIGAAVNAHLSDREDADGDR